MSLTRCSGEMWGKRTTAALTLALSALSVILPGGRCFQTLPIACGSRRHIHLAFTQAATVGQTPSADLTVAPSAEDLVVYAIRDGIAAVSAAQGFGKATSGVRGLWTFGKESGGLLQVWLLG